MADNLFFWEELCMGTYFQFQIKTTRQSADIAKVLNEACKFLHEADETFSLYKPNSDLSKISRNELKLTDSLSEVQKIARDCEDWKVATSGWFDAVSPKGTFDPSGIVKTWAAKQACMYLEANGYKDFTLNAGGDVYLSTELSVRSLWKIGLANLNKRDSKKAGSNMVVDLYGTKYVAAATSGSLEKGEHIWSKNSGRGTGSVLQVTVIADELVKADVWATAIFAGGLDALEAMNSSAATGEEAPVAVITFEDGAMLATSNFANLLVSH